MANKENIVNKNFRIKLLAGNNVILVEADNYESEIFAPQIVNGRITFSNIIPNRRCCQIINSNVMNYALKESQDTLKYLRKPSVLKPRTKERFSAGQYSIMCAPLANSTPAGVKQKKSCGSMLLDSETFASPADFTLPTPEPVRRAVAAQPKLLDKSLLNLPKGVRVSRIYHNSIEGTPKKVGRLITCPTNIHANVSALNESFNLDCSPLLTSRNYSRRRIANLADLTQVDSLARWNKVLTPVRTYTKNSKNPVMVKRPLNVKKTRTDFKSPKVTPTYLLNPTQAPKVAQRIEIRKRKLILDKKTSISPKSFKKQQKESIDVHTASIHPKFLCFHKPRRLIESHAMSAFDLLTNSNHQSCIARNLNEQFRKRCVNKASSTYSKYKVLSMVPPLQHDEQVLELSRISVKST